MKIRVSGTLLRFVDYEEDIDIEAATAGAALDALVARYPDLRSALHDAQGNVRAAHALFVNGESVGRHGLDRVARPGHCLRDPDRGRT